MSVCVSVWVDIRMDERYGNWLIDSSSCNWSWIGFPGDEFVDHDIIVFIVVVKEFFDWEWNWTVWYLEIRSIQGDKILQRSENLTRWINLVNVKCIKWIDCVYYATPFLRLRMTRRSSKQRPRSRCRSCPDAKQNKLAAGSYCEKLNFSYMKSE